MSTVHELKSDARQFWSARVAELSHRLPLEWWSISGAPGESADGAAANAHYDHAAKDGSAAHSPVTAPLIPQLPVLPYKHPIPTMRSRKVGLRLVAPVRHVLAEWFRIAREIYNICRGGNVQTVKRVLGRVRPEIAAACMPMVSAQTAAAEGVAAGADGRERTARDRSAAISVGSGDVVGGVICGQYLRAALERAGIAPAKIAAALEKLRLDEFARTSGEYKILFDRAKGKYHLARAEMRPTPSGAPTPAPPQPPLRTTKGPTSRRGRGMAQPPRNLREKDAVSPLVGRRIVAIDPGITPFLTYYSEAGYGFFGLDWYKRVIGLLKKSDELIATADRERNEENAARRRGEEPRNRYFRRCKLKKAAARLRARAQAHVAEMHWHVARELTRRFDVIILPQMHVQEMVSRADMPAPLARALLLSSQWMFSRRLIAKAYETGAQVILCDEHLTSKTCTKCGFIKRDLGAAKHFDCDRCGLSVHRDYNGARNVLLRVLSLGGRQGDFARNSRADQPPRPLAAPRTPTRANPPPVAPKSNAPTPVLAPRNPAPPPAARGAWRAGPPKLAPDRGGGGGRSKQFS